MNGELAFILAQNGPELVQGVNMAIKGRKAKVQLKEQEGVMEQLMNNRQKLENPALNMTNPFANLSVATQAAEMQMQQTDQALANTLDTLRATGTSAGGATALARAAAQSKQGIAASIETQEVNNEKLRAEGQQALERAQTEGEIIRFQNQEAREDEKIYFAQRKADRAQDEMYQFQTAAGTALTGAYDDTFSSVFEQF
tara:strand:+ start:50 stop:646 length:597 start_codon:yes stop_codon:yes gene_type:complete